MNKFLLLLLLAFTLCSCKNTTENVHIDYASYVNQFIGTGGHGHTFSGSVVPNGMIQPSFDTRIDGWDACSGYYSVLLDRYSVKAELSATKRAAIHRYTFPESDNLGFILDIDYSIQRQCNLDMHIDVLSDTELCGYKTTKFWAFGKNVYHS